MCHRIHKQDMRNNKHYLSQIRCSGVVKNIAQVLLQISTVEEL